MNKHILFPIDFSQRSKELVPYVFMIARQFDSAVTLFHVLGPYEGLPDETELMAGNWLHYQDHVREQRKNDLRQLTAAVLDGVRVNAVVDVGEPADRIVHYAREYEIGLIMMATHGRGTFRRLLLGSITSKVLHDSPIPVWTTAHAETWAAVPGRRVRKLLCALDPARDAQLVLEATIDVASVFDAEVILVHAISIQNLGPDAGLASGFGRFLCDAAKKRIAELQIAARTNWGVEIDIGSVASVIRDAALRNGADLVIIGRGGFSETFGRLRSNVGSIIREAPCPVLSASNDLPVLF